MFDGFIVDVIILTSLVKISCLAFRNASENWRFYRYVCAVLACREKKQKGKKRKERNGRAVSTSRVSLEKKKEKLEIHKRSFIDFASYDNIVDSRVIFTIFGWNAWSFDFLPLESPQRDHSLSLFLLHGGAIIPEAVKKRKKGQASDKRSLVNSLKRQCTGLRLGGVSVARRSRRQRWRGRD